MIIRLTLLVASLAILLQLPSDAQITRPTDALTASEWTDVSAILGVGDTGESDGVALVDYDNDDDIDIYVTNFGNANKLYRNDGGSGFVDVAATAGVADAGNGLSSVFGDIDNDGDLDLYVVNFDSANKLFRNEGDGSFADITTSPLNDTVNNYGATFGDLDLDNDLDLYLVKGSGAANILFRNDGSGNFVTASSTGLDDASDGRSAIFGDIDDDGDSDVFVVNSDVSDKLFRNEGELLFVDITAAPLNSLGDSRGAAFADLDNDLDLDIFLTTGGLNKKFRNEGGGVFVEVTGVEAGADSHRGVNTLDYDLDGDLDIYVSRFGAANFLFRQDSGVFANVSALNAPINDSGPGAGTAFADIDGDGDLDIYVANEGVANKLFRNDGVAEPNHYLGVKLVGTFSNSHGIGAKIRVVANTLNMMREVKTASGYWSQSPALEIFGVGSNSFVDSVIVYWPSGGVQIVTQNITSPGGTLGIPLISADQVLEIQENVGWRDISSQAGIANGQQNFGVAFGDVDNDDDEDIYVTRVGGANTLYRNEGNRTFFDFTSLAGDVGGSSFSLSCAFGDLDNDGDLDLYVVNLNSSNKFYRNEGGGFFADATAGDAGDVAGGQGVILGDIENDGDLDVYLLKDGANVLLRNDGGGVFVDVTSAPLNDSGESAAGVFSDLDNDGDLDLFVAVVGPETNKYFRNEGGGTFVDVSSGDMQTLGAYTAVSPGDMDNDGDIDLFVCTVSGSILLLRNDGNDVFFNVAPPSLNNGTDRRGATFGDLDNDGDLDLYVASASFPNRVFRNEGGAEFTDITDLSSPLAHNMNDYTMALADIEGDGDLDIFVTIVGSDNKLFLNDQTAAGNDWLHVKLQGVGSNRSGIGAQVRVVSNIGTQLREVSGGSGLFAQNSLPVEFGLGVKAIVSSITVQWPSGIEQIVTSDPASPSGPLTGSPITVNRIVTIVEDTGPGPIVEVLAPTSQSNLIPGETVPILWTASSDNAITSVDIAFVPDVVLYGTRSSGGSGGPSWLYRIDVSTGAATQIGSLAYTDSPILARRAGAVSMDIETGMLIATAERSTDLTPVLIEIDPQTAGVKEIGPTGIVSNVTGLSFDRESNILYGNRPISGGGSAMTNLYWFNVSTGAANLIGSTGESGSGGAIAHSLANRPFLALEGRVFDLNLATGAAISPDLLTFSAPLDFSPRLKAMDFHPLSGLLYGIGADVDDDVRFVQINPGTGGVTNIGVTESDLDGLAFGPDSCITIVTGESNDGSYSWTVPDLPTNAGRIKVTATDEFGKSTADMTNGYFNIINQVNVPNTALPTPTFLSAVAPNPFTSSTTLRFGLSQPGPARLAIYDARGRLVRELISGEQPAGEQVVRWDGRDQNGARIASGFYIVRLAAGGQVIHREVSFLR